MKITKILSDLERAQLNFANKQPPKKKRKSRTAFTNHQVVFLIIITRPKPAYGRQGLAGSWGQDTDKVSTFWVFLTSHFAPAALSSELNQPGTIHDDTNPPGIMKTRPGAIAKT